MTEYELQRFICRYLDVQYPKVIYASHGGGVRLPMGLAVKVSKLQKFRAFPDLAIYAARPNKLYPDVCFHGLLIELKRDGVKLKKKDDSWISDHVREQSEVLEILRAAGYRAEFAVGEKEAKELIDKYLTSERY